MQKYNLFTSSLPLRYKRYIFYIFLTILLIGTPFIEIHGNQVFLLSFEQRELHLLGIVFHSSELYLLPFLLMFLFIGIFFLTTLGGRIWCGWGCPQTLFRVIYRDLIETKILGLRKSIANKQKHPNYAKKSLIFKKILALTLFSIISLLASAIFLFYFVPPKSFLSHILDPKNHTILFTLWISLAAFMTFDITFMAENFCTYICPYARVQSVLLDNNTLMPLYDVKRGGMAYDHSLSPLPPPKKQNKENECVNCLECVKVCPAHIDIRKGMQLECIHCLECVDACTNIMGRFAKPSLIQWRSTNSLKTHQPTKYLRPSTISYILVLCIILIAMIFMGQKKESILVSIDRNTQLYSVRKSGAIDNFYTFLFENVDKTPRYLSFKILNQENIIILRPQLPILVQPGQKLKEVVVLRKPPISKNLPHLSTNPTLTQKDEGIKPKDLEQETLPLKIQIFDVEDESIKTIQESIFISPKDP